MRNICKKHLCWSLFPIKKFKATLLQRDFNTGVFVLKNICKRVLLWGVISTRSGFCTSCPFKILVSERNYKNNLKLWISKNNLYNSHVMFICFTTKSRDFTKVFKDENPCFLNLHSVHTAKVLDHCVKSVQIRSFFLVLIFPYSE